MKKIFTFMMLLVTLLLNSFITAANEAPISSLTFYIGQVTYKSRTSQDWQAVKKGMVFYEGDQLKTMDDGKAELFFYTGSKVRIANGTEIEFSKDDKTKARSIFLKMGQVWSKVRKGDKFEVESIHGVASVKGTEFDVANNGSEMNIFVLEGLVLIQNANGQVLAEKNTKTILKKEDKPDKQNVNDSQLPKWQNDFKAEAALIVSCPGNKIEGKPFKVYITLKDIKNDKPILGEIVVNLKSLDKDLLLSKNLVDWSQNFELRVIDGVAEMQVKGAAGEHEVNITGAKFTGTNFPIKIEGIVSSRVVNLKYMGKDLKEHNINIKYKLK